MRENGRVGEGSGGEGGRVGERVGGGSEGEGGRVGEENRRVWERSEGRCIVLVLC